MERVCVVGPGGAGESRLGAALAERTGLPFVALDRVYWRPGWVQSEPDEWARRVTALVAEPRCVDSRWQLRGHGVHPIRPG